MQKPVFFSIIFSFFIFFYQTSFQRHVKQSFLTLQNIIIHGNYFRSLCFYYNHKNTKVRSHKKYWFFFLTSPHLWSIALFFSISLNISYVFYLLIYSKLKYFLCQCLLPYILNAHILYWTIWLTTKELQLQFCGFTIELHWTACNFSSWW